MGAYLRHYPEFFGACPVRDPGLIASEGRMSIPVEDNTPAGILDIRHHYFEFIPEDQGDREEPETVETVAEPFLVREGLVSRTPRGRVATAAAYEHLGLHRPDDGALWS